MRSGTTFAKGFAAGGLHCGVKKDGRKDLAIIVSTAPAVAAGMFTTNRVKGAPVLVSQAHLRAARARAIVVNSGNANAVTKDGVRDAEAMTQAVAAALGCSAAEVLVASTGVIGQPLPIAKIETGVAALAPLLSVEGGSDASEAILTTDTGRKEAQAAFSLGGKRVSIGGCGKGAGMIHPSMATMLAFVTTDAAITRAALRTALRRAAELSFHRITVDGDTSTSDTVIVLANGASGAPLIDKPAGPLYGKFLGKLTEVCQDIARQIVRDGEGATKFATIRVTGAASEKAAKQVAMSIARSSLVKTALFGQDANWGRILCAAGYAGVPLDVNRVVLKIGGELVFRKGGLASGDWEDRVAPKLRERDILVHLDLGNGSASAEVWTCDLSYDYVKINAAYRT